MTRSSWGDFPVVKFAGREFQKVPRSMLPRPLFEQPEHRKSDVEKDEGKEEYVLLPVNAPDDHKEFPKMAEFEGAGPFLKSGIAMHKADFMARPDLWASEGALLAGENAGEYAGRVCARDLVPLDELSWHGECYSVLEAHGWINRDGDLTEEMTRRVVEAEDNPNLVAEAREAYGENWTAYIKELAAKHFAPPLSRLWYAANMMSLYYCHYDDMRFGFLWAEYQIRMRAELFALKHMEQTERNRESGMKGGQADKKRERYAVLDRLGKERRKELAFASDSAGVGVARRMAAEYDKGAETPLFMVNRKNLSRNWYGDWLAHFRQIARDIE